MEWLLNKLCSEIAVFRHSGILWGYVCPDLGTHGRISFFYIQHTPPLPLNTNGIEPSKMNSKPTEQLSRVYTVVHNGKAAKIVHLRHATSVFTPSLAG